MPTETSQLPALREPTPAPELREWPAATFLFADIVGFAAFTERHGDARAAELAWRLRRGVERELPAGAAVVKCIGDAVMVRLDDPAEALEAGVRIAARALPTPDDPQLRVGIDCGPAIESNGDFFGSTVNLAARIAAVAEPGEVVVTASVAAVALQRGLALRDRGRERLHNVTRPVRLHAAPAAGRPAEGGPATAAGAQLRRSLRPCRGRRPLQEALNV